MRRVDRDHESCAAAAASRSICLKALTLSLLFVADLLIWSRLPAERASVRCICYAPHIHEILRPFGAYWDGGGGRGRGGGGGGEEVGRQGHHRVTHLRPSPQPCQTVSQAFFDPPKCPTFLQSLPLGRYFVRIRGQFVNFLIPLLGLIVPGSSLDCSCLSFSSA